MLVQLYIAREQNSLKQGLNTYILILILLKKPSALFCSEAVRDSVLKKQFKKTHRFFNRHPHNRRHNISNSDYFCGSSFSSSILKWHYAPGTEEKFHRKRAETKN